ncbi:MAG: ornithine carbamoyltransferase [Verrucomicrobiales bacterium]|jgi:ornithine carbamoyltransferase
MKHLLSIEELSAEQLIDLIDLGQKLKTKRKINAGKFLPLANQCWGLIFTKSSTRTRVSFEIGVRELGGAVMFLSDRDLQLGRGEPIEDTARVLGRMLHGCIIRTEGIELIGRFAELSGIPTINALDDAEHPCQILADLLTIKENLGNWEGRKVIFAGDTDCNVARSWMWAAERLNFQLVLAGPKEFHPPQEFLQKFKSGNVTTEVDLSAAAKDADVLYTDVWVSMGKEEEAASRLETLRPYQINQQIVDLAKPEALVMHCLPAYRDKEITAEVLEAHADTIFQEAENRLHAQKAVLVRLAEERQG